MVLRDPLVGHVVAVVAGDDAGLLCLIFPPDHLYDLLPGQLGPQRKVLQALSKLLNDRLLCEEVPEMKKKREASDAERYCRKDPE